MHPNQQRALAYLERKGTKAPFSETIGRLRRAATAMEDVLATVGETAARRRPGEGRWSVQEVADHLVASHRPAFEQWRAALEGRDPGPAVEAYVLSTGGMERSFRSIRRDLEAVHREWLELAEAADEKTIQAAPTIPVQMVIKGEEHGETRVFEWIEPLDAKAFALAIAVHTREHEAQVRRTLDELARDASLDFGPDLVSERLRLRPVRRDDADALQRLFNRPRVRRYLFDDEEVDAARTREIIDSSRGRFRSRGYGLWLALHRDGAGRERAGAGELAGFGGYGFFFEPPELQIFFGLAPESWGRGLASELTRRLLEHGFEDLGFDQILGATDPPNEASARLMERLGMERLPDQVRDGKRTLYFRARSID